MNWKAFSKSGHVPTLLSSFFYFDICFAIWVLNGALAPFLSEQFHLTPAQKCFMISVPILSGALLRFPLGLWAQRLGRKNISFVIMSAVAAALLYGWLFVQSYTDVLIMGVLLGIGGASFGIALSLGSGWFPPEYKGLAMGIAGAGNSGTVIATLFGPLLARRFGWQATYGLALIPLALAMVALLIFAKEPPDRETKTLKDSLKILVEKDTWIFNLLYVVTFGGFIGLTNFLPTFFRDQYGVSKVVAGQFTAAVVLMGSMTRILGGYLSDRVGGIRALTGVFILTFAGVVAASFLPSIYGMTAILLFIFAGLGTGNGAVFQLVPLRFPTSSALASSIIGEAGALGGAIIPNAMGWSQQWTGTYWMGFAIFAAVVVAAMATLLAAQGRWTSTWVGKGGRAIAPHEKGWGRVIMVPAMEIY